VRRLDFNSRTQVAFACTVPQAQVQRDDLGHVRYVTYKILELTVGRVCLHRAAGTGAA